MPQGRAARPYDERHSTNALLCRDEQAESFQAAPHLGHLVAGRIDQGQAVTADLVPEQAQRGLDRDRVRLHLQQLVRRTEGLVELCLLYTSPSPRD